MEISRLRDHLAALLACMLIVGLLPRHIFGAMPVRGGAAHCDLPVVLRLDQ
jgi:hypothetical protein